MDIHSAYMLNAFLVSLAIMRPLISGASRFALTDEPGGRKQHEQPTPVVGGIAIFIAFAVTVMQLDEGGGLILLPGFALLVLLGVRDDAKGMNALVKLAGQSVAAFLVLVPGGLMIAGMDNPLGAGTLDFGPLAWPMTLLFVVALINAFNMIDGIDGAAGGMAATTFFWIAAATGGVRPDVMMLALILAFATLGFLVYNIRHPGRHRAEVFLGDAGSMFLGGAAAVLMVMTAAPPDMDGAGRVDAPPLAALAWTAALPCADMASVVVRRLMSGRSPFAADRRHLHHLLVDSGLSVRDAAFIMIGTNGLLGAAGLLGWWANVPDDVLVGLLVVPAILHASFVAHQARARRGRRGPGHARTADTRTTAAGSSTGSNL